MSSLIFGPFKQWFVDNRDELRSRGIAVTFVQGRPTAKTGAYLDIDTEKFVARVTLWESMELVMDALSVDNRQASIFETHQPADIHEALVLISEFVNRL